MTEDLEIHIIEIPKINKMLENGKLKKWILFLENPEGEETKRMAEKEKEIKETVEKLDSLSEDERMQRIADLREKAILDEKAIYAKGLEEGSKKEKIEIAKKMLEKNISIETIIEIAGLTQEEIEKIKSK